MTITSDPVRTTAALAVLAVLLLGGAGAVGSDLCAGPLGIGLLVAAGPPLLAAGVGAGWLLTPSARHYARAGRSTRAR